MRTSSMTTFALAVTVSFAASAGEAAAQGENMQDMMEFERPIAALDNIWIEELTMLEVRDALREGTNTALILTGGIEENGPYLTTGKHNHVLRVMGDAIARRLGNTLVAPIVTIEPGNPETASSPGGIRFSQETYQAVLRDMAVSLKAQGFTRIFMLGDSGGKPAGHGRRGHGALAKMGGRGYRDRPHPRVLQLRRRADLSA